jgi:hypothetical protein
VIEFDYKLFRYSSGPVSTLGLLMAGGHEGVRFRCYTLEDEFRAEKIPGKTRIPAGRYEIKLRTVGGMHQKYVAKYPWHRGMLWLQNVPNFEWVYMHPGNKHEHTEGCILTGDGSNSNVLDDGSVTSSVVAYERLAKEVYFLLDEGKRVFITVEDFDMKPNGENNDD